MTIPPLEMSCVRPRAVAPLATALVILITATAAPATTPVDEEIAATMETIIERALEDDWAYVKLGELCDRVGHRLAGSEAMRRASAWMVQTMREAGFDAVWTEPVTMDGWERGREWARCTAPTTFDLTILGLGFSDGTGPEGIEAEILAVSSFDELEEHGAEAAGKIVLFDMEWQGYGKTVRYRRDGASAAARHGAVACLIRSVTNYGLNTPHTGMMRYADDAPRIPIAAVTVEDAGRLHRLHDDGLQPRVHLTMGARNLGEVTCLNTIGDVTGRSLPEEIVLVGGHLDSWDAGTGAHDDGAGCLITLAAVRLLKEMDLIPQRTLRVVGYTAEEIGGPGGDAYRDAHLDELDRHVAALECDSGGFDIRGFGVKAPEPVLTRIQELSVALAPLGELEIGKGWAGVDIGPIVEKGVPGIGHRVHGEKYFHYHHSTADTFDKIVPEHLARNVAAVAALIYALAEEPVSLRAIAAAADVGGTD